MIDKKLSEAITEVMVILDNVDKKYREKLSPKFYKFLEENKSDSYTPKISFNKKLKDMDLKKETRNLLEIMYINYWSSIDEKEELKKILNENEILYLNEINEKYNPDNIFKKQKKNEIENDEIIEQISMVKYNESFFKKIWNKIISMIKK